MVGAGYEKFVTNTLNAVELVHLLVTELSIASEYCYLQ